MRSISQHATAMVCERDDLDAQRSGRDSAHRRRCNTEGVMSLGSRRPRELLIREETLYSGKHIRVSSPPHQLVIPIRF